MVNVKTQLLAIRRRRELLRPTHADDNSQSQTSECIHHRSPSHLFPSFDGQMVNVIVVNRRASGAAGGTRGGGEEKPDQMTGHPRPLGHTATLESTPL